MKLPEIPISPNDLLLAALFPALVSASISGLHALLPLRRRDWLVSLAMTAAFAIAYPMINGTTARFPPNSAGDWLYWLSVPIGVVAGVLATFRAPAFLRQIIGTLALAVLLYFMMQPAMASRTVGEWWTLWGILVAILSIDLWFIDRAIRSDNTLVSMIGLTGILLGACILIQMSGSLKFSLQGGALVASLAAVVVMTAAGLSRSAAVGGAALVSVAIVGSLLAVSIEPLFVNVKVGNALLIAAAPVLLWLSGFVKLPHVPAWLRAAVRLALPAVPVLIALAIAGAKALADLNSTGSEGYYGY